MVVVNGGNYTGDINAKKNTTVEIEAGGTFAPNTANNFAADLTNNGTVILNNVSLDNGASINNSGSFTWASNWNQNSAITVSNTACGGMTFNSSTNVGSGAVIDNNGTLTFASDLNTSSGATIDNRGRVTVMGNFNSSGLFYNEYKAVFKGSSNIINSGGDSIVNLAYMTFAGSLSSSTGIRNEGLFTVGGSYSIKDKKFLINNSNAQLRVKGALALTTSTSAIGGNGSLHVPTGALGNSGTISGISGAHKLTVNQSVSGGTTSNLITNTGLTPADTATYVATMANADICSTLPVQLSSLQAAYKTGAVQLNWSAYSQSNGSSFTIEYSQDAQTFAVAGEVTATGNNNQTTRYEYTHYTNLTGTIYYRIRETDKDAHVYYSNIVLVKTGNALNASVLVFPNPFTNNLQINLQVEKAGAIHIALYDAHGRLVKQLERQGLAGRNTIAINDLSNLLPGVYFTKITTGDHTIFEKLIK